MKVLTPLIVPFVLCNALLASQSLSLEEYISENKRYFYDLEEERIEQSSDVLRDSWISPIMLNYSYGVSEAYDRESTTQKASISIDQPIFQSGGIYFGIKFAEASRLYSQYSADVAKRKLIKDALSLLFQIKQSELKIQKQQHLIDNARINLELKTEQFMSGQIDSSFLDDAIIEKNTATQVLYDLETAKERLISGLRVISDVDYTKVALPTLAWIQQEEFMRNNLSYKLAQSQSQRDRYNKNMTLSKYLPQLSVYGGYNYDRVENLNFGGQTLGGASSVRETDYLTYGFKASMPLNINSYDDIQSTRLEYLKSKTLEIDKKREVEAIYEQVLQNIENFEKKIALSKENEKLYAKILSDTKELFEAGYKTHYDVDLLENSYKIQGIDLDIFKLDRQLELLTLYEIYANESE